MIFFIYAVRQRKWFLYIANQCSKSVSYLSSFFGIINTITDDNNSRVSYAFHSFSCFYFVHQKCSKILHIFAVYLHKSFHTCPHVFHGSDVLQPMLVFYMTSFFLSSPVPSKNAFRNFLFFFLFLNASWLRFAHACSRLTILFLFLFFVYSNLHAFQLVTISLLLLPRLFFFDSTNSERCFSILRANTNYNFLIYGNDFTQIQELRSHCRRRRLF